VSDFFPNVGKIKYEGPDSKNAFAFKHYSANEKVMGKTMAEHLRFAVCLLAHLQGAWRRPVRAGHDDQAVETRHRMEMEVAEMTLRAAFELFSKLGVEFWCFHDRDNCARGRRSGRNQPAPGQDS